jgi:ABC-2 type transport system ATP-binding protein
VSAPVLVATDLARRFGATEAVRGVSLTLAPGELYGLVGPDGAGKTTTLRLLAGVMKPDAGTVRVVGEDPLASSERVRNAIGYMPQQYSLYGDLSIAENLRFFARMFLLDAATFAERRVRLLALTRLAPFEDRRADALSGGMYKKLALACALLPRPEVLLLDEPTNGVDPVSRRELWALLFELTEGGMSILVSTAYMDEAERCHRVGLLDRGRLLVEGTPRTLLAGLELEVLEVSRVDGRPMTESLASTPGLVAESGIGSRVRVLLRPGARAEAERALTAQGLVTRALPPTIEDLFVGALQPTHPSAESP